MKKEIIQSTIILGALAALAIQALADDDDKTVDWKNVPAAVQSTITANANGGKVGKIETEAENGATTYEAKVKGPNGEKMEIEVAADGTLVETETKNVDWNNVPASVQNTITANANGDKVGKIEEEMEKGATTYEARVKVSGKKMEIKVAADGPLIKTAAEDEDDHKDGEHKEGEDKD
jgi:uncharacterized membrane protein YkoI